MALGPPAARGACRMRELREMPVTFVGGLPMVDATINGHTVRLTVDTGSEASQLFADAAASLGLTPEPPIGKVDHGAGGATAVRIAHIDTVIIGNMTAEDVRMFVTERRKSEASGVLGAETLLRDDVEFDFPHNRIRFFDPKECKGDQLVYWGSAYSVTSISTRSAGQMEIPVTLNGAPLLGLLDTGSAVSSLTSTAAAIAGVTWDSPGVVDADLGRSGDKCGGSTCVAVFSTFGVGDEVIRNARLEFSDSFSANRRMAIGPDASLKEAPQMLLGVDFFRAHRVYISRGQRNIYLSYVGGPVFGPAQAERPAAAQPTAASSPPK